MILPCIICGKELKPALSGLKDSSRAANQPNEGTTFHSHGQYGSTVWDPMSPGGLETLEINICDPCLLANKERVLHVSHRPHPGTYKIRAWVP